MIILTIPYRTVDDLVMFFPPEVEYIEYRLDYCAEVSAIDWTQFTGKTILTIRDKSEGGHTYISDEEKCEIIKGIISQSKALIDIEYMFIVKHPGLLIPAERLIISLHTKLSKGILIKQFIESDKKAAYYKLAVSCQRIEQLDEIITLLQQYKAGKYILIPLAPCSITARMLYRLYGSCATYVYDQSPVTRNQLSIKDALLSRINQINQETYIYGIIGKQQVLKSLSFYLYNKWFSDTMSNRVFLPIVVNEAEEAISMISWISNKAQVKGFAVTMPFKQSITPVLTGYEQIINSWFPDAKRFNNTDAIAMEQSIMRFMYRKNRCVVVYGKGATAQTALNSLRKLGYTNVKHQFKGGKKVYLHCKLLINCTPFGLKRTDNPNILPRFESLIDLPYGKKPTTLVNRARKLQIRYIDGYKFWLKQAKFQAAFFALEPEFIDSLKPRDLERVF